MKGERFDFPKEILWKCQRCTKCCGDTPERERRILLLPSEAKQIREAVKVPSKNFCRRTGTKPFTLVMKKDSKGKCVFLRGSECQIYSIRPLVCRFYPLWLEKKEDESFSFKVTNECSGIGSGQILDEAFFANLLHLALDKMKAGETH